MSHQLQLSLARRYRTQASNDSTHLREVTELRGVAQNVHPFRRQQRDVLIWISEAESVQYGVQMGLGGKIQAGTDSSSHGVDWQIGTVIHIDLDENKNVRHKKANVDSVCTEAACCVQLTMYRMSTSLSDRATFKSYLIFSKSPWQILTPTLLFSAIVVPYSCGTTQSAMALARSYSRCKISDKPRCGLCKTLR